MKVSNCNYGQLNVLMNSYGAHDNDENHKKIAEFNQINLFTISKISDSFKNTPFFDYGYIDLEKINNDYNHPKFKELYELIEKVIVENNIKLFVWLGDPIMLHSSFIEKIKKVCYVSAWTFDDPMTSERVVKPVADLYDCIFHVAPYYEKGKTTKEVFESWGAKRSELVHNGVNEGKYNKEVGFNNRDIDIVFVGTVFRARLLFVFKLIKYYGNRIKVYGRGWDGTGMSMSKKLILKILKWYYNVDNIKPINNQEYLSILKKAKIGVNDHQRFDAGPSSARTFELPANGVLQLCDVEVGLKKFFDTNKEIIPYSYKNADEVIKKIDFYLENESKRLEIVEKSYKRTMNNYMIWHSFEKIIEIYNSEE